MIRRYLRYLPIILGLAATSVYAQRGPAPTGKPTGAELEVHEAHKRFATAWNTHDPNAIAALWTETGDYTEPDGRTVFGRNEVKQLFTYEHKSVFKDSELHLVVERVRLVNNSVAIADGSYEVFHARDAAGNEIPTRSGYFTSVLVKEDGEWKVSASRLMLPQVLIWRGRTQ
jgi:uncharacterized protein (TIGR02246 family)